MHICPHNRHAHPTSSACGAHHGNFNYNLPQRGYTDWTYTGWGHWAGGGFAEITTPSYACSRLRDRWWYVLRLHFPSSWATYTVHLIEYVNLIMLLCLMKQVRLDQCGHMGRNKKIIEQSDCVSSQMWCFCTNCLIQVWYVLICQLSFAIFSVLWLWFVIFIYWCHCGLFMSVVDLVNGFLMYEEVVDISCCSECAAPFGTVCS